MKRMMINAKNEDELRVVITALEGREGKKINKVQDLSVEATSNTQTKNNIFLGRIVRIEPSLEAAFVEYSSDRQRHGFLPLKEIAPSCYSPDYQKKSSKTVEETPTDEPTDKENSTPQPSQTRSKIRSVVKEGQEILVQVEKEERGAKGAALTTYITLAGSFLVLMPNNPNTGGISRRIEGAERSDLREILNGIEQPENMGLIVRTAGIGKTATELQHDLNQLLTLWNSITEASKQFAAPKLIYQESNLVTRALRDYLRSDIEEVIVDEKSAYEEAQAYIKAARPDFIDRVVFFDRPTPIFNYYEVESQIETAFQRAVLLPSGGSIVIDHTEALTSIDINSSKSTSGSNIEETAVSTNTEAAHVIAQQLRLRDLGGLIVIDFIDMQEKKNRDRVEHELRHALHADRARIQVGEISSFGLLEMSRQRLRPSLGDTTQIECPRCGGQGSIRSVHSLSHTILRLIEESASKENTIDVRLQVPIDVATYLLNEKKSDVLELEKRHETCVYIIPNENLQSPHYVIERTRGNTALINNADGTPSERPGTKQPSFNMVSKPKKESLKIEGKIKREEPAVSNSLSERVVLEAKKKPGLINKILDLFVEKPEPKKEPVRSKTQAYPVGAKKKNYRKRYHKKRPAGPRNENTPSSTPPPKEG